MRTFDRSISTDPRAFTLIETALATLIIGTGVLAIVLAQQAFHQQNNWANRAATGMRLASEIREMTFNLPRHDAVTGSETWGPESNEASMIDYDDVDDFDGAVFSHDLGNGPVSALRQSIPNLPGWLQRIEVARVDPFDVHTPLPDGPATMLRVEAIVEYQGPYDLAPTEITRLRWLQSR